MGNTRNKREGEDFLCTKNEKGKDKQKTERVTRKGAGQKKSEKQRLKNGKEQKIKNGSEQTKEERTNIFRKRERSRPHLSLIFLQSLLLTFLYS